MMLSWLLPLVAALLLSPAPARAATEAELNTLVQTMENKVAALGRQLMLQQLFVEEKIRSDGDSGIKKVRLYTGGTRPYHAYTHNGGSLLAIHDHADFDRTIGMGEFSAVLNGVEFRTRHNDYRLRSPHRTSKTYNAMEDIPFPKVPPQVLNKKTVQEQINELRLWFKAWKDQDFKTRDYRPYFKANLCYLEGAWTTNTKTLEEPFKSDRHFVDATSWFDLQNKIRFTSYNGRKSLLENYAYLPTAIHEMYNGTEPHFAQWNYRILCHAMKNDLPLDRFRPVDDVATRVAYNYDMSKYVTSRRARFSLSPFNGKWPTAERFYRNGLLDDIMAEIPGRDNYPAKLVDDAFGHKVMDIKTGVTLNTGYYHRWYKVGRPGSSGTQVRHRGYSDASVFMAQTSQPQVAPMTLKNDCQMISGKRVCGTYTQRWTYAVPLEIVYTTPLSSWNPYNLQIKARNDKSVTANGRNGGFTAALAYDGLWAHNKWFLTPSEFYSGKEVNTDKADTSGGARGVLDRSRKVKSVKAAGARVFFPNIPGVGVLRQRYPIIPVHAEGSATYKEVAALSDMVMEQAKYLKLYRTPPVSVKTTTPVTQPKQYTLKVQTTARDPPGVHFHTMIITQDEYNKITNGQVITKTTSLENGHSHRVAIGFNRNASNKFFIKLCDSKAACWDGHAKDLILE